ncbi:MAG: polysaccharide biosynthesis tyrosine autokinase [Actinomycetota bacterium]|nr:polysaccharide biosynthesis tyrosine autokinase [Actinomycetota bacterium]
MALADSAGRDLRDYLSVLRRRKTTVVLAVFVVAASALAASLVQTKVYEGRARVLLEPRQSLFQSAVSPRVDPVQVETEMQFIQSEPVKEAAREKLGVVPDVSVTPVGSTSVVDINVRAATPRRAAELATGYANAYIDYRRSQASDELEASGRELQVRVDELQKRIDALAAEMSAVPCPPASAGPCTQRDSIQKDRDALINQQVPLKLKLDQFQVDSSLATAGAELIAPSPIPKAPVQPRPVRNTLLGLGLGLVVGVALALLLDHLDDSIKSKEDLERILPGLPVLGMIPAVSNWRNRSDTPLISRVEPNSPTAEAYRTLRTSIQFSAIDRTLRTLTITSPSAAEGKTTTTANLAVALARAGQRVVVVSCDLRRPRIHEFFGLANDVGFTSVVVGELPLSQALQDVPGENGLRLMGSGPLPPNPSELLASSRADEVLRALQAQHDMVLLDCSPVLPVTDAAVLSSKADGTLLVATVGTTTGKQAARAIELLRQVGAPVMGTVLNGVEPVGAYGYTYSYYRRDKNGHEPKNGAKPKRGEPVPPPRLVRESEAGPHAS